MMIMLKLKNTINISLVIIILFSIVFLTYYMLSPKKFEIVHYNNSSSFSVSPIEKFEIVHYNNSSSFSVSPIYDFSYKPYFYENYLIKYEDNTTATANKYFFNDTEASNNFFKEILTLFRNQTKSYILENYSFEGYNGYYLSIGKPQSLLLLKGNLLLTFLGENKKVVEKVSKWFIEKFA